MTENTNRFFLDNGFICERADDPVIVADFYSGSIRPQLKSDRDNRIVDLLNLGYESDK